MLSVIYIISNTSSWNSISRGLLAFATGSIVIGLGYYVELVYYYHGTYVDDPNNAIVLCPFDSFGNPALVVYAMWRYGHDDLRQIRLAGYDPGVIPLGAE